MPYRWPEDTEFTRIALAVEEQWCRTCGGALTICDHRHHRVFTLTGPCIWSASSRIAPRAPAPAHPQTLSPEAETAIAMPWWVLGWDVVCWLGQRRFARHWSVGQLRAELADTYQIRLSADAIETVHSPLPTDAGGPPPGSRPVGHRVCGRGGGDAGHRWAPTRRKGMKRSTSCANWSANGSGLPSPCCPVRRPRSSSCWSRPACGPSGWANRCGSGCRTNKTRSCAGSRRSFQGCHTAIVRITSCGMWPSRCWTRTAVRR
jgi:hypothetical protein